MEKSLPILFHTLPTGQVQKRNSFQSTEVDAEELGVTFYFLSLHSHF